MADLGVGAKVSVGIEVALDREVAAVCRLGREVRRLVEAASARTGVAPEHEMLMRTVLMGSVAGVLRASLPEGEFRSVFDTAAERQQAIIEADIANDRS